MPGAAAALSAVSIAERGTRSAEPVIVHVASGREWRGGQRQVVYLAEALAREDGVRQLVVTGRGSRLERELGARGLPAAIVPWSPAFDPRALLSLLGLLRTLGRGAILHAHDSHALTLAALAATVHGAPLVATRRVDFPIRHPFLWRRAARVVAISEAVRRVALASGLDPARLVVVPSGIPLDPDQPFVPRDLRTELGLAPEMELAVSVGALVPHKGFDILVAAAARLRESHPRTHWVIAGDGPLRGELEQLARAQGLAGRVHFLGEVPDGRPVLAAGTIAVVSSREEGLNTSVLDAMALGVPVVGTDAGGLPELLGAGAGLLAPRGDPPALAARMAEALDDPALAARLVATARQQVVRFSSARMAAGMLSVYHSVATAD